MHIFCINMEDKLVVLKKITENSLSIKLVGLRYLLPRTRNLGTF